MDFDFSDTEKLARDRVKGLFDHESRSSLAQLGVGGTRESRDTLLYWLKRLGEAGYLALGLEDVAETMALVAAQEALAAISPSLFLSVEVSTRSFGRLIARYGTPEQKTDILPVIKGGELIGTVALSEETVSMENNPLTTLGTASDDGYLVSGVKSHVVNAPLAHRIAVAGKTEGGLAFFLIEKGSEGLSVGGRLSTLGYEGIVIAPVSLVSCPVPAKDVIGPFDGTDTLRAVRVWEDHLLTVAGLGLMQRCFDAASSYAKGHVSGGRPIIGFQEVGFKLAEMLTLLQTAQLLAYRAAWMTRTNDREAGLLGHCAKVFATECAEEVASKALQILGGHGLLVRNPVEQGYRDVKYLQIFGNSTEISRMKIGDGVLGRK